MNKSSCLTRDNFCDVAVIDGGTGGEIPAIKIEIEQFNFFCRQSISDSVPSLEHTPTDAYPHSLPPLSHSHRLSCPAPSR